MSEAASPIVRLAGCIVRNVWFQRLIVAAILMAGVLAGMETDTGLVQQYGGMLHAMDRAILGLFVVEIALKLAAQGRQPWRFFHDGWNVFDLAIVVICCLPLHSQFAAVLRLARGLRLLRLVSALPKLQMLVGALLKSLGAMGYVTLLLSLMFYIYGVAGVHLFATHAPDYFGTLGAALLSLFQIITLDNWSDILAATRPGSPLASMLYFISFILLGTMIMMNLFIGIIMNSMAEMHAEIEGTKNERSAGKEEPANAFPDLSRQLDELRLLVTELKQASTAQGNTRETKRMEFSRPRRISR